MPEKAEPKISTSEAVLIGMFVLTLDALDIIPLVGEFTDLPGAGLFFYYYKKHINGIAYIISEGLDLIPIVQWFPWRTVTWGGTVLFDRFAPAKVEEAVESLGEKAEGGEGGAAAGVEGEGGALASSAENAEQGAQSGAASAGGTQGEESAGVGREAENLEGQEGYSSDTTEGREGEEGASGEGQEGYSSDTTEGREGEEGASGEGQESGGANGNDEDVSATESEREPMEENKSDLLEKVSTDAPSEASEEEEEAPSNVTGIGSSEKWQNNQKQQKTATTPTPVYDVKPKKKAA